MVVSLCFSTAIAKYKLIENLRPFSVNVLGVEKVTNNFAYRGLLYSAKRKFLLDFYSSCGEAVNENNINR